MTSDEVRRRRIDFELKDRAQRNDLNEPNDLNHLIELNKPN